MGLGVTAYNHWREEVRRLTKGQWVNYAQLRDVLNFENVLAEYGVTYEMKDRIVIPLHDQTGQLIGYAGRRTRWTASLACWLGPARPVLTYLQNSF